MHRYMDAWISEIRWEGENERESLLRGEGRGSRSGDVKPSHMETIYVLKNMYI